MHAWHTMFVRFTPGWPRLGWFSSIVGNWNNNSTNFSFSRLHLIAVSLSHVRCTRLYVRGCLSYIYKWMTMFNPYLMINLLIGFAYDAERERRDRAKYIYRQYSVTGWINRVCLYSGESSTGRMRQCNLTRCGNGISLRVIIHCCLLLSGDKTVLLLHKIPLQSKIAMSLA